MNIKPKLPFEENKMFDKWGLAKAIFVPNLNVCKMLVSYGYFVPTVQYIKVYVQEYDDDVRDYAWSSYVLPSNRVISSPFSHKTFFFTKLCEGFFLNLYFP